MLILIIIQIALVAFGIIARIDWKRKKVRNRDRALYESMHLSMRRF